MHVYSKSFAFFGVQQRQFTTFTQALSCVSQESWNHHVFSEECLTSNMSALNSLLNTYLMFSMVWIKYSGERLIAEINKWDMKISCIPCVQQGRQKKTIWSLVRRRSAKDVTTIRPPSLTSLSPQVWISRQSERSTAGRRPSLNPVLRSKTYCSKLPK